MISKQLLRVAGILSLAVAVFQVVITIVPKWALYFGAGEQVVSKLWLLYTTGFIAALFFFVFGLYAFSGIGLLKRLPLLRAGLVAVGIIYTLRGLFIVLELLINAGILQSQEKIPAREIFSSAVSLCIGLIYLFGTFGYWSKLPTKSSV